MTVRVRLTDKAPADFRKRLMTYRTRHLVAEDPDAIELSTSEALTLCKAGFAEEVTEAPKRGGRPPKAEAPDPTPAEPEVPEPTHAELMARAEELGVELPSGYVRKDDLAELIREAEKAEAGDA